VIGFVATVATVVPGLIALYDFTQATGNVINGVTAKKYAERDCSAVVGPVSVALGSRIVGPRPKCK
jgi:hypothetical protein